MFVAWKLAEDEGQEAFIAMLVFGCRVWLTCSAIKILQVCCRPLCKARVLRLCQPKPPPPRPRALQAQDRGRNQPLSQANTDLWCQTRPKQSGSYDKDVHVACMCMTCTYYRAKVETPLWGIKMISWALG